MTTQSHLSSGDAVLFQEAVVDTAPLAQSRTDPIRRRPPPRPIEQPGYLKLPDPLLPHPGESPIGAADELFFVRPGVPHRVLQALRRGHLAIDLELDLHGLTAVFAEQLLDEFLAMCRQRRLRCVRIIHGKGSRGQTGAPVLKRKVNDWLPRRPEVLAFCSTPRHAGGTGAVYVLLKSLTPIGVFPNRR